MRSIPIYQTELVSGGHIKPAYTVDFDKKSDNSFRNEFIATIVSCCAFRMKEARFPNNKIIDLVNKILYKTNVDSGGGAHSAINECVSLCINHISEPAVHVFNPYGKLCDIVLDMYDGMINGTVSQEIILVNVWSEDYPEISDMVSKEIGLFKDQKKSVLNKYVDPRWQVPFFTALKWVKMNIIENPEFQPFFYQYNHIATDLTVKGYAGQTEGVRNLALELTKLTYALICLTSKMDVSRDGIVRLFFSPDNIETILPYALSFRPNFHDILLVGDDPELKLALMQRLVGCVMMDSPSIKVESRKDMPFKKVISFKHYNLQGSDQMIRHEICDSSENTVPPDGKVREFMIIADAADNVNPSYYSCLFHERVWMDRVNPFFFILCSHANKNDVDSICSDTKTPNFILSTDELNHCVVDSKVINIRDVDLILSCAQYGKKVIDGNSDFLTYFYGYLARWLDLGLSYDTLLDFNQIQEDIIAAILKKKVDMSRVGSVPVLMMIYLGLDRAITNLYNRQTSVFFDGIDEVDSTLKMKVMNTLRSVKNRWLLKGQGYSLPLSCFKRPKPHTLRFFAASLTIVNILSNSSSLLS